MRFVNTDLEITPYLAKYFEYIELFESLIKEQEGEGNEDEILTRVFDKEILFLNYSRLFQR